MRKPEFLDVVGIAISFLLMAAVGCAILDRVDHPIPSPSPAPLVSNLVNNVVAPDPAPSPNQALPFDRTKCVFKRIDPATLEWRETRKLTITKLTAHKVWSQCDGPDWKQRKDGLQGTFNLVVEQSDGALVVGSWDYNRSKHQTMKGLENLYGAEHSFFGIRKGCRLWIFTSASNRDRERTVLERSSIEGPFTWEWEDPQ